MNDYEFIYSKNSGMATSKWHTQHLIHNNSHKDNQNGVGAFLFSSSIDSIIINQMFTTTFSPIVTTTTNYFYKYNWFVLTLCIFPIFGTIGNVLLCLTIKRDHSLQNTTNYYLFSLALTDLGICLFVFPVAIVQDFLGNIFVV
jgi:hypothetical protein